MVAEQLTISVDAAQCRVEPVVVGDNLERSAAHGDALMVPTNSVHASVVSSVKVLRVPIA